MRNDKKTIAIPLLLVTLGSGWLLTTLGVFPAIDWAWTLGVALVGILTFLLGGLDKVTVVIGPLFLIASCLSVLRQAGRLDTNLEVPILVIVAGVMLLVARSRSIPAPRWLTDDGDSR